jgi:tetratricopeptide (TPR) repeat protein
MKKRKDSGRRRIENAERYHTKASDLFICTESDSPDASRDLRVALVNIKRALMLDPDNYEYLVLTGNILFALDDTALAAEALGYYDRAISIEPENPDAYDSKSGVLMYWSEPPDEVEAERLARKAATLAERAEEESELLALTYSNLFGILESRKKFAELRWTIRKALKRCPSEFLKDLAEATLMRITIEESEESKDA